MPHPPGFLRRSENPEVRLMIGTAGHVDHGKTRLVRLLTGCETDRLKAEKERGLSIELGFAPCSIGGGLAAGIVDVPGHEQFIKNMVAGAAGMDMAILVVAADDGVMPQTIEHLQIMEFLGVQNGMVAVTKIDLATPERVEEVKSQVGLLTEETFLEGAPVCPVSSETGEGYSEFYTALVDRAVSSKSNRESGVFRMPVEKVFFPPGFGAVATGIPLGGKVSVGEEVEIQPRGFRCRVRGMQRFLREATEGGVGQCLALNLAGASLDEIHRGSVVTAPGALRPGAFLSVRMTASRDLSDPIREGEEIRFHTGTLEIHGRLNLYGAKTLGRGQTVFGALRLTEPIPAGPTDRFVIRRHSPSITVAGGTVLRVLERKPKGARTAMEEDLRNRWRRFASPESRFEYAFLAAGPAGTNLREAAVEALVPLSEAKETAKSLVASKTLLSCGGDLYLHRESLERATEKLRKALERHHAEQPGDFGPTVAELEARLRLPAPVVERVIQEMESATEVERSGSRVSMAGRSARLDADSGELVSRIEEIYRKGRFVTPRPDELPKLLDGKESEVFPLLDFLCQQGTLIRLGKKVVFHRTWMEEAKTKVVEIIRTRGELDSADFKSVIGASRKYALAILDYLDTRQVTHRYGNIRKLHPVYLRRNPPKDS